MWAWIRRRGTTRGGETAAALLVGGGKAAPFCPHSRELGDWASLVGAGANQRGTVRRRNGERERGLEGMGSGSRGLVCHWPTKLLTPQNTGIDLYLCLTARYAPQKCTLTRQATFPSPRNKMVERYPKRIRGPRKGPGRSGERQTGAVSWSLCTLPCSASPQALSDYVGVCALTCAAGPAACQQPVVPIQCRLNSEFSLENYLFVCCGRRRPPALTSGAWRSHMPPRQYIRYKW